MRAGININVSFYQYGVMEQCRFFICCKLKNFSRLFSAYLSLIPDFYAQRWSLCNNSNVMKFAHYKTGVGGQGQEGEETNKEKALFRDDKSIPCVLITDNILWRPLPSGNFKRSDKQRGCFWYRTDKSDFSQVFEMTFSAIFEVS